MHVSKTKKTNQFMWPNEIYVGKLFSLKQNSHITVITVAMIGFRLQNLAEQ